MLEILAWMLCFWIIFMVVACCLGTLGQNIKYHWDWIKRDLRRDFGRRP
jgi:hypothetical protein